MKLRKKRNQVIYNMLKKPNRSLKKHKDRRRNLKLQSKIIVEELSEISSR